MPTNVSKLTADEVRAMLDYDPATGFLRWKVSKKGREMGHPAGARHSLGYLSICIDYKHYSAQHLVWLIVTGEWAKGQVGFKNGVRDDIRWDNLQQSGGRKRKLTAERAREMLDYDPATGIFRWRKKPNKNVNAGDWTGCLDDKGYIVIRLDGRTYQAGRLAWLIMTGEWPEKTDHRNLDRSDNRFENLRAATHSQNGANTGVRKHNQSGIKGVQRQCKKWAARITVGGQLIRLGTFPTPEEAHAAYMAAAQQHFGEFARAQ